MKTQELGTRDWGLGARLSVASSVSASSPQGTGDRGLGPGSESAAGYYKRNNTYINVHTTYKIKHTPVFAKRSR
jgi:hypothetical protein